MSKFLYPIYKLKIDNYKKWWLYHKKAGSGGILSDIIEGTSFYLENTLDKNFNKFDIIGRSMQGENPSPANPQTIYNTGDEGFINEKVQNRNLFDKNDPDIANGWISSQTDSFQVEEGSTATDYVAHEEQVINFPLQPGQNFYERDYLADDGVHHVMKEITINGSETNWRKTGTEEYYTTSVMADAKKNTANGRLYGLCDKVANSDGVLPYAIISKANANAGIDLHQAQTYWGFTGSTVEEFTAWLAENPITLQYKLETEIIDPYTSEQQAVYDQIEALRTYKGGTLIDSENLVKPLLKIQYYKEG